MTDEVQLKLLSRKVISKSSLLTLNTFFHPESFSSYLGKHIEQIDFETSRSGVKS